MNIEKIRDLTIVGIDNGKTIVIACDSCGSIGNKEGDILKIPPFYTGKFTVRVGILEVMCAGAEIITVVDSVCNEMEPTGREIISGIKKELEKAGIQDVVLTGSTEENFKTFSTALGVTVIGIVDNNNLKLKKARAGDVVISIGIPKFGEEIDLNGDKDMVSYEDIKYLLSIDEVHEIIPVGSKGILYEAENAALNNGLKLCKEKNIAVEINKSAGPATCVIALIREKALYRLNNLPYLSIIGRLQY